MLPNKTVKMTHPTAAASPSSLSVAVRDAIRRRLLALAAPLLMPALAAAQAPGSIDPDTFDLAISGGQEKVFSLAVQPDGAVLVGGPYQTIDGANNQGSLARLESGGGFDDSFSASVNGLVTAVAVLPDGKILIAGNFDTVNGTLARRLARLQANGDLDTSFDAGLTNEAGWIYALAVQPDGRILVGGDFTVIGTGARRNLARLLPDGMADPSFDTSASATVYSIALQEDGKILVGGDFANVQPAGDDEATNRNHLARLHPDGTVDEGFDPNPNSTTLAIAPQPDGKIVVGGSFNELQPSGAPGPIGRSRLARLLPDGQIDADFDPNPVWEGFVHLTSVDTIALQTDGSILFGGTFTRLQPPGDPAPTTRNRIARLLPDGSIDAAFDPNADGRVIAVALRGDGKILAGGEFGNLQPNGAPGATPRGRFARLLNGAVEQEIDAPNSTRATWTRGGASPEVSAVFFELSEDDGDTWTPLGLARRLGSSPDWELRGLSLPSAGILRATGRTTGGQYNGSSGLVSFEATYALAPARLSATRPRPFPTTPVGRRSRPQTIRLTNTGGLPVTGLTVRIAGPHRRDFLATRPAPALLQPEGSSVSRVTFRPGGTRARVAQAIYRGRGGTARVPLRGRGRRSSGTRRTGAAAER